MIGSKNLKRFKNQVVKIKKAQKITAKCCKNIAATTLQNSLALHDGTLFL